MVRLAILVLAYVAVSASTPCSGACLPLTTVGGCHAQDGQESCGKHFAFGGATADTCEYNSAYQESICSTLWHAEGTARKCAEPVKDCPVVLAGQQCSLQPSGGGQWCISGGACTLSAAQAKLCSVAGGSPAASAIIMNL
jgi:hypothetical protein